MEKAEANFKTFSKTNSQGKTINYANGVSIDTDNVIYIENGPDSHTYTFNIKREGVDEDAPLENLVLSVLPDGNYKELLFSYNFTKQERLNLLAGNGVATKGKTTVTELEEGTFGNPLNKMQCSYKTVDVAISCYTGEHNSGNRSSWSQCQWKTATDGFPPQQYTVTALVCGDDLTTDVGTYPGEGGGGPLDGGGVSPGQIPTQPVELSSFHIFVKKLQPDLKAIINAPENKEFSDLLLSYYDTNYGSDEARNFIKWAIQFKADNPNISLIEFTNWFMTKGEGQDGEYDEVSESIFSQQSFQQHPLPSLSQYELAFPSKPNPKYPDFYRDAEPNYIVYNDYVGGKLKQLFNQNGGAANINNPFYNACAVRQSYAHNKLGIIIPFQHNDLKGDNNWNYIMTASKMGIFLEKTYGQPTHKLLGADANNPTKIKEFLEGKTGIYLLINSDPTQAGYTGHTDMIKNGYVSGGSAINLPKVPIKYIYIWELN